MPSESQSYLEELRRNRINKLQELLELGIDPFPQRYDVTHSSKDIQQYEDDQFPGHVSVAGRIVAIRRMGKASFAHLMDFHGRQQVYIKMDLVGEEAYNNLFRRVDLGDFLGVAGRVFRTRTGEITVEAAEIKLLAKGLRPIPGVKEKDGTAFDPFQDKETRYRKRYLDLIANPNVKDIFIQRAKVISSLRRQLDDRGFIEVETPALQPLYGGASARPFTTYHNTLDQTMYLRIADELYLKRLIIGGFDRVYEIAKNFRNEGMDRNHNPEFTALEFYQAYADFEVAMETTEELIRTVASETVGTRFSYGDVTIDLGPPFEKACFFDLLSKYSNVDFSSVTTIRDLYRIASDLHMELAPDLNYGQAIDKFFSILVEPNLVAPTFVIDYPRAISPLAKAHRNGNPDLVERFELFIAGMEFANAFTELNDPLDQRQRFENQSSLIEAGDDEAQVLDEDFLEAMEYGMPPMGGVGIGIDRLVMLLTGQTSIKDVILFPVMRPPST